MGTIKKDYEIRGVKYSCYFHGNGYDHVTTVFDSKGNVLAKLEPSVDRAGCPVDNIDQSNITAFLLGLTLGVKKATSKASLGA